MCDVYYGETSGKEVIHDLISDDTNPPPRSMRIEVKTESGKKVCLNIPYDNFSDAWVTIDGEQI